MRFMIFARQLENNSHKYDVDAIWEHRNKLFKAKNENDMIFAKHQNVILADGMEKPQKNEIKFNQSIDFKYEI